MYVTSAMRKSEKNALVVPMTDTVQTMLTLVWITGVVHANDDALDGELVMEYEGDAKTVPLVLTVTV